MISKEEFNQKMHHILWDWMCTKTLYATATTSYLRTYAWRIIDENLQSAIQKFGARHSYPITYSTLRDDEKGFPFIFFNLNFFSTQQVWHDKGFAFEEDTLALWGSELVKHLLNSFPEKNQLLNILPRLFPYSQIINYLNKEDFNLFISMPPPSFIRALSHHLLIELLKKFTEYNMGSASYESRLYEFISVNKKLMRKIEVQTIIGQFILRNIEPPNQSKYFKLMPKIQNKEHFYLDLGESIICHIDKNLFYQTINLSGAAIDRIGVAIYLKDFVSFLHKNKELGLLSAHLIDDNKKYYSVFLQTNKNKALIDYKNLIQVVTSQCSFVLNTSQNRPDAFNKCSQHYLLDCNLPGKVGSFKAVKI